jgi:hypothetical protein
MVDGIPQFRPNKIFDLDPLKIRSVEVIPRNFVLGNWVYHGLANFSSYTAPYEGLQLDAGAISIDYEGLQLQREFYSPDYSSALRKDSRLPDLRSTLYWTPDVNKGAVRFFTGDNKGKYLVVVEGTDATGKTISGVTSFRVE